MHVTARGNRRAPIFVDDDDRRAFLALLEHATTRGGWRCVSYCLMGNHFHLVLEEPRDVSAGMRFLNGVYAQRFNARHDLTGHLFEDRYYSVPVESDGHLAELARYVVLNPVRAGLAPTAGGWPWSSYQATVGLKRSPSWLRSDRLLHPFGSEPARARARFAEFVAEAAAGAAVTVPAMSGGLSPGQSPGHGWRGPAA